MDGYQSPSENSTTIGGFSEGAVSTHKKVGETVIESHEEGSSIKFHDLLLALDERAAARVREAGCPRCGGPLYAAHYERKVRGISAGAAEAGQYGRRLSLCCGREGCRARATPPSLRFAGRRVYAAITIVVLSLGTEQVEASTAAEVWATRQSPTWSTRARWLSWWRSGVFSSPWFSALCAQLATPVEAEAAPGSLLARFAGSVTERMTHLLVWLAPLTTASLAPERSRVAMAR